MNVRRGELPRLPLTAKNTLISESGTVVPLHSQALLLPHGVPPTPAPARSTQSPSRDCGCSPPHLMWETQHRGQGAPHHQVLPVGGAQQTQAFCQLSLGLTARAAPGGDYNRFLTRATPQLSVKTCGGGGGGGCGRPTTTTCIPQGGMCVWGHGSTKARRRGLGGRVSESTAKVYQRPTMAGTP